MEKQDVVKIVLGVAMVAGGSWLWVVAPPTATQDFTYGAGSITLPMFLVVFGAFIAGWKFIQPVINSISKIISDIGKKVFNK